MVIFKPCSNFQKTEVWKFHVATSDFLAHVRVSVTQGSGQLTWPQGGRPGGSLQKQEFLGMCSSIFSGGLQVA